MSEPKKMEEKTSRERALIAARAADAKKATDIMVQEVRDLIGVTDYFVIATAANNRQVEAIVDEIEEAEQKIDELTALLNGRRPRKAFGVIPRDW